MNASELTYHKPVLVREVLTYLSPQPGDLIVDATFGGGGHSRAILAHQLQCKVIALDWDRTALDLNATALTEEFPDRFRAIWGNFAQLPLLLAKEGIEKVDGILADFGTSQYQIKHREGFSFASDTPLDMRMSPAHQRYTAADLVNRARLDELEYILRTYGEEPRAKKLARAIYDARRRKKIRTTKELVDIVLAVKPRKRRDRIHPATTVFQALRVAVNRELENIEALLQHSISLLNTNGRLVCISFHSLEDRLVKQFLKGHADLFTITTKKVVRPTAEEVSENPSSRSARLRAAVRT